MTISFGRRLCRHIFFPLALLLYAALPPQSTQAARQIAAAQIQEALSAKPFLEWTLDPGGKLGIQEISSPEQQNSFASLDTHFPPHQSGTLWLRFTLGQRALESRPATLLLDMSSVPGTPLLFIPKNSPFTTTMEWQDTQPSRQSIFLLPEAQSSPQTMYIRLEGLPGPWFAPMLRTPHNAATSWERMVHPAILVALSVIMLLCLLRGLTERGQWRIWTCLYTGATLAHAAYGMPATPDGIVPIHELPGVLAPGIALMLLPHVGRHLMQTRDKARGLDAQYMLLSLPGAALALLPLVPGFAWTSYYLALWPLATALFIPTSLGAWLSGLPGARRFLLACLASIIGGTAGVLGMYVFASSPFFPAGPLLGVGLGALFIAGTAIPRDYERESRPETAAAQTPLTLEEAGLRLVTPEEMSEAAPPSAETPSQPTPPPQFLTVRDEERHASLEGRLRPHLDSLLRESAGIAMCALPPAARQHAEAMANSGRAMASLLNNSASDMLLDRGPAHTVFNLPQLLCEAHNQLAGEAERKGLRISWFMPPHLPQYYLGNVKGIAQVIRLLMESSIRATQQGFVQLAVRRVPESVNPGHLLFSISDSGSGMPPHTRSSLALARAWELTGIQGGSMSAESDARGATITFTLQLKTQPAPQMEMDAMMQTGRVLIIDELSSNRQLLAFLLEGLPCSVEEARNIEDAVQTCRKERAALLLIDCDMPEAENLDTLKMFLAWEHERELPATPVLAIESEGGAWNGLSSFENVHRLVKPVTRDGLRKKVSEILQQHVVSPAPGTDSTRHENGAPDVELPLDLPQPVEYGPSFAPAGEQFIPLSLDQNLSLTATPEPRAGRVQHPPVQRFAKPPRTAPVPDRNISVQTPRQQQPTIFPGFSSEMEWVGEPTPVTRTQEHASPIRSFDRQEAQPARPAAVHDAYSHQHEYHQTMDEWVGEPTPVTQAQGYAPLLRPFDRQEMQPAGLETFMEETAPQPSLASDPQQGGLLDWIDGARAAQVMPQPAPPLADSWSSTQPSRHLPAQSVPPAVYAAHSQYRYQADEWVGEPMPLQPRAEATPVSRTYMPSRPHMAATEGAQRARQPAAAPRFAPQQHPDTQGQHPPEQRATPPDMHPKWTGAPGPMPVSQPAAIPAQHDFIPLRLTNPHASPAAPKPLADPVPLFPEDDSLLGFILGRPGRVTEKTAAAPSQPTRLARAARGLVNLVRAKTDASLAEERKTPGMQQNTPHVATVSFGAQKVPPPLRETQPVATERSSSVYSGSAVDQIQPLIPGLLSSLDEAMTDVRRGFNKADTIAVEEAAARIAAMADNYGLRILARMARCVEMAARARDKDALTNILPDLETAVERNKIALQPKQSG